MQGFGLLCQELQERVDHLEDVCQQAPCLTNVGHHLSH